jgi:hypothetical protein
MRKYEIFSLISIKEFLKNMDLSLILVDSDFIKEVEFRKNVINFQCKENKSVAGNNLSLC